MNRSKLYFTSRGLTFGQYWNNRMRSILPISRNTIPRRRDKCLDGGQIYGEIHLILEYLNTFLKFIDRTSFALYRSEQRIMNVIVHKKFMPRIQCVIDAVNNSGAALTPFLNMENFDDLRFGHVLSSDKRSIALFVHQYDRYFEFVDDINKVCNQSLFGVSDFTRHGDYIPFSPFFINRSTFISSPI